MTPPIVTKIFFCPVIGTGSKTDGYRPIIQAMVKRLSMAMHRLQSLPTYCVAVVTGPVNEVNKLNTQLDVILIPNSQAAQMLFDLYGQKVVDEVQTYFPTAEAIKIYPRFRSGGKGVPAATIAVKVAPVDFSIPKETLKEK